MLKHCIFATYGPGFGRDFELAAVTAFSKILEKRHFLYRPTVSPQFHKNVENRGSPHNLFGGPCRSLAIAAGSLVAQKGAIAADLDCTVKSFILDTVDSSVELSFDLCGSNLFFGF